MKQVVCPHLSASRQVDPTQYTGIGNVKQVVYPHDYLSASRQVDPTQYTGIGNVKQVICPHLSASRQVNPTQYKVLAM